MIRVEFDDDAVTRALARARAGLDDMTGVMQDVAEDMLVSTQDRMQRGETPDGAAFAPRSPTTIARYAARGWSYGAPLNRSGEMRQQMATSAGADFAEIGSNAIQAAVMQFGAAKHSLGPRSPWGDIPARPYLGISERDRSNVADIVETWLGGLVGED